MNNMQAYIDYCNNRTQKTVNRKSGLLGIFDSAKSIRIERKVNPHTFEPYMDFYYKDEKILRWDLPFYYYLKANNLNFIDIFNEKLKEMNYNIIITENDLKLVKGYNV